jgi:hypothetical protein
MTRISLFSSKVDLPAGEPLGGNDPARASLSPSDALEVNGFEFSAGDGRRYRLCSVDALYPGRLVDRFISDDVVHIFAASHTHNAPMLDDGKPHIGRFSRSGYDAYVSVLLNANNRVVEPSRCRLYRAEVDVPVYRRFDYPETILNRLLASRFGFYPNEARKIDRSIYLLEIGDEIRAHCVVVYHACHPVTRSSGCETSPDYVGSIRQAVRERFGVQSVLFLQGCGADVRPNLAKKRVDWLPKSRLNWKFDYYPDISTVAEIDAKYAEAIYGAKKYKDIVLGDQPFEVSVSRRHLSDGREVRAFRIAIANSVELDFLPFEVSHLYHLGSTSLVGKKFIVSCSNDTIGYLAHPSQHRAGGYEVHGSLHYMGLKKKIEIKESNWFA